MLPLILSAVLTGQTAKKMVAMFDYDPEVDSPNDPEDIKVLLFGVYIVAWCLHCCLVFTLLFGVYIVVVVSVYIYSFLSC